MTGASPFYSSESSLVALGLGSNLGDRLGHLRFARREVAHLVTDMLCSRVYETEPLHVTDQSRFLNACCTGRTTLSPRALLRELQAIERAAGREAGERYGPRTLDLDILVYGQEVIDERGLAVPHPHMPERGFVLVPLAELLPEWRHPVSGQSVSELAGAVPHTGVHLYDESAEARR